MTEPQEERAAQKQPQKGEDDSSSSSSDDDDDDLVLEGVLVRNRDVSDSDDTSSEESEGEEDKKPAAKKRSSEKKESPPTKRPKSTPTSSSAVASKKKSNPPPKQKEAGPEIIQVEFIFCDMKESYFYGISTLLKSQSPFYALTASGITDAMVENVAIGTVVATDNDPDTIWGFGSILNITQHKELDCFQTLTKTLLDKCPPDHLEEFKVVLSGSTKRPAGWFLHGRMVNTPLEIVQSLHQQLVLDMDWAVEQAEDKKSVDFGAFVRIAPSYRIGTSVAYKFFDDELFASRAEFTFEIELPKTSGMEETPYCSVIVITKTGHREAMKAMAKMVNVES